MNRSTIYCFYHLFQACLHLGHLALDLRFQVLRATLDYLEDELVIFNLHYYLGYVDEEAGVQLIDEGPVQVQRLLNQRREVLQWIQLRVHFDLVRKQIQLLLGNSDQFPIVVRTVILVSLIQEHQHLDVIDNLIHELHLQTSKESLLEEFALDSPLL